MSAVHILEGGRHPAVLDVPTGALEVAARPASTTRLSLVIPTFNESRNLPELVARLSAILERILPGAYELLVVDDDSHDETWAIALQLADRFPTLRVIRRRGEKGLSTAVVRGWQAARGDVLAVIDADLQHPPEVVERLWGEIVEGADLAVGSRHSAGGGVSDWSALRRALSRGAQLLGLCLLPGVVGRVSDPMSGYFMVRRSAIAGATLSPLGYKIMRCTIPGRMRTDSPARSSTSRRPSPRSYSSRIDPESRWMVSSFCRWYCRLSAWPAQMWRIFPTYRSACAQISS